MKGKNIDMLLRTYIIAMSAALGAKHANIIIAIVDIADSITI
ncbi:MAG TPA: hypothetical protein VK783_13970 [Bacteroidia bacterium]|nr:hypothetical protein [Bacteroidia bacterium]